MEQINYGVSKKLLFYYYIDTDEIASFFRFLKKDIFIARSEDTILYLSFMCEDIGVAIVTNMISQLQESFPLRCAAGPLQISFGKWLLWDTLLLL